MREQKEILEILKDEKLKKKKNSRGLKYRKDRTQVCFQKCLGVIFNRDKSSIIRKEIQEILSDFCK